jgi:phage terminase large subunit
VYFGGNKIRPAAFEYPNGSLLIVQGLDRRDKLKSMEFDIALLNEGTELEEEDAEYVRMRLRHGKLPYHQLIIDINPGDPGHWINQMCLEGRATRLVSKHEDNPRYFDTKLNDWTEAGREYIEGTLGGLTGVLLDRYRYGLWSAAEGAVYRDAWNRAKNVVTRFDIPREWSRWLGVDFGYNNPFVCKWYAQDPDGRLYVYREIYMSQKLVEDHAKDIAIASGWFHLLPVDHPQYKDRPAEWADPLPRAIICDHDSEDRATLERHLRMNTIPAKKSVSDGIQEVASRLRPSGDGKPRLMYFADCLVERDKELARKKHPTSSIEEFGVYVWDTRQGMKRGEAPMKMFDHGQDVDRYICKHFATPNEVTYSNRVY